MTFEWPTALVLLLAIPLLVGVQVVGTAPPAPGRHGSRTPRSSRTSSPRRRGSAATCPSRSCSSRSPSLFVGVARPHVVRDVTRDEATVLTIDTSRSMQATDVEPNRFDAAKSAARAFLEEVPDSYAVGIVSFSTSADPVLPPTTDREAAETAISELRLGSGTALGQAIVRSADVAVAREDEEAPGRGRALARRGAPPLRRRPDDRPGAGARSRAARASSACRSRRSGSGRATRSSRCPGRRSHRAGRRRARPARAAPDRADDRGPVLRGAGRGRPPRGGTASSGRVSPSTASGSR